MARCKAERFDFEQNLRELEVRRCGSPSFKNRPKNTIWVVSKNRGTPKMDDYIMENHIKMDDLGGYHYFWNIDCLKKKEGVG